MMSHRSMGGCSPDHQIEVVNIHNGEGGYFEIRDASGKSIFSDKSLDGEFFCPDFAWDVLWRSDSKFVAIAFGTTKFSVETVVFRRDGKNLVRVPIPEYDKPDANLDVEDTSHREPHQWLKNGNLVLDVTTGYHTKSDGGISGYLAAIRFVGIPLRGIKVSQTESIDRD